MLVLHIGYAKCATTFLQKNVYPALDGLHYLGRHYSGNTPDRSNDKFLHEFVFGGEEGVKDFGNYLSGQLDAEKITLLSHENFIRPYKPAQLFERLKVLEDYVGELKIILTIRNQADLILSRYVHDKNAKAFKHASISDSLDFSGQADCKWPTCSGPLRVMLPFAKCPCRKKGAKVIHVPLYDYERMVSTLSEAFGADRVHVIVTEKLRSTLHEEVAKLTACLGLPNMDDDRLTALQNIKENVQRNIDSYEVCRAEFTDSGTKAELERYFSGSNKMLSEKLGLGLDEYGYF